MQYKVSRESEQYPVSQLLAAFVPGWENALPEDRLRVLDARMLELGLEWQGVLCSGDSAGCIEVGNDNLSAIRVIGDDIVTKIGFAPAQGTLSQDEKAWYAPVVEFLDNVESQTGISKYLWVGAASLVGIMLFMPKRRRRPVQQPTPQVIVVQTSPSVPSQRKVHERSTGSQTVAGYDGTTGQVA